MNGDDVTPVVRLVPVSDADDAAFKAEVNAEALAKAEEVLGLVKSGAIVGIAYAVVYESGEWGYSFSRSCDVARLIAACSTLEHRLIASVSGDEP